jgi:hypothetical protein
MLPKPTKQLKTPSSILSSRGLRPGEPHLCSIDLSISENSDRIAKSAKFQTLTNSRIYRSLTEGRVSRILYVALLQQNMLGRTKMRSYAKTCTAQTVTSLTRPHLSSSRLIALPATPQHPRKLQEAPRSSSSTAPTPMTTSKHCSSCSHQVGGPLSPAARSNAGTDVINECCMRVL